MTNRRAPGSANGRDRPVAVADLGSNSFRLVVYRPPARAPVVLYNERIIVGLARTLGRSGKLRRRGCEVALATVLRFHRVAEAMGAQRIHMVATAAIRDADDGGPLVEAIRQRTGVEVEVMGAHREARLAANGLMAGIPDADGILGDMGGGSIEFARVCKGKVLTNDSLPAGMLRLMDLSRHVAADAEPVLTRELEPLDWLHGGRGRPFYAIGGSWRALARALQSRTQHPLPVIHGYQLNRDELLSHLADLAQLPARKLPHSIPSHRRRGLPFAAAAMLAVMRAVQPSKVVFSGFGLREGILLDLLKTPEGRPMSPLEEASASLEPANRPFVGDTDIIADWLRPTLRNAGVRNREFLRACARLADLAWNEHPDHRARYAFDRIALRPLLPVSQMIRIRMALALYARYTGAGVTGRMRSITGLIPDAQARSSRTVGLALRLAMTIGGGTAHTLESCRLELHDGVLILTMPRCLDALVVRARLKTLAEALGGKHRVVAYG
jgi:exopolyphosphatase/guanosine-5'-triphosphate,3'-diphosphate pyrophosphatase